MYRCSNFLSNNLIPELTVVSLTQLGSTVLLHAAAGGSVELIRMLLEDFHCSLDEVNNVSMYISNAVLYCQLSLTIQYFSDYNWLIVFQKLRRM